MCVSPWKAIVPVVSLKVTAPGVTVPIAPLKVVPPEFVTVSVETLSTLVPLIAPAVPAFKPNVNPPPAIEARLIAAPAALPLVVSIATAPVSVVAELKFTASAVVVTLPAVLMPVAPVRLTAPSELMTPAAAIVSAAPVAFSVTVPPNAPVRVSMPAFTAIALAAMFTPLTVSAVSSPPIVVVPVPAVCVRPAALNVLVSPTLLALVIVTAPSAVALPTVVEKVTLPVPAVRPRVWVSATVPLSVPLKRMLPAVGPVVISSLPVSTTLLLKVTLPPAPCGVPAPPLVSIDAPVRVVLPVELTTTAPPVPPAFAPVAAPPVVVTVPTLTVLPLRVTAPPTAPVVVPTPPVVTTPVPPETLIAPAVVRFTAPPAVLARPVVSIPLKVVVPVPAVCVRLLAQKVESAITLAALVMVTTPSVTVFPTAPVKCRLPAVPAVRVRSWACGTVPLSVLPKVMFAPPAAPPALVVSMVTLGAASVVVPVTATVPAAVVRLPFSVVAPV